MFFFQAEDGIRDLVRSRGLGDVYKRQDEGAVAHRRSGEGISAKGIARDARKAMRRSDRQLSLIHI